MEFNQFKHQFQQNFNTIIANQNTLYKTNVDKELMWETYLNSFPEEEKQDNNCNCCKSFIRNYGNVVAIVNGKKTTLWQFFENCEAPFNTVAKNMHDLVRKAEIINVLVTKESKLGTDKNIQLLESGITTTWQHMYFELPRNLVNRSSESVDTIMGNLRAPKEVFKRSLEEISLTAVDTVLELIAQNSLYRGQESKGLIEKFRHLKVSYDNLKSDKELFCWENSIKESNSLAKIRNSAIGTLLIDLTNEVDLDKAVSSFERIMAPSNYKRPIAIITKKMVENAEKEITELGYVESLGRQFATKDDIKVNNLLFVDRDKKLGGIFEELKESVKIDPKKLTRVEEVTAKDFIEKILPTINEIEVLVENKHESNFVSVIAPKVETAPSMFKWGNGFSWSYKDAMTDSLKEKVKAAGGRIDGFGRVSLEWFNYDDLDLHITEPNGDEIYFGNKISSKTSGQLDVDMNAGGRNSRTPVENIVFPNERNMVEGNYKVYVNQFSKRESLDVGFNLELELNGELHIFSYPKAVISKLLVATFNYSKSKGFIVIPTLESSTTVISKNIWNIDTNKFHKVNSIMKSPNYWDDNSNGNEHVFFIVDAVKNSEIVRGFFNEFLKEDLLQHKRVFEALGSKMKVEQTENQLSGLGFSSTGKGEVICKVKGSFERLLKIKF